VAARRPLLARKTTEQFRRSAQRPGSARLLANKTNNFVGERGDPTPPFLQNNSVALRARGGVPPPIFRQTKRTIPIALSPFRQAGGYRGARFSQNNHAKCRGSATPEHKTGRGVPPPPFPRFEWELWELRCRPRDRCLRQ